MNEDKMFFMAEELDRRWNYFDDKDNSRLGETIMSIFTSLVMVSTAIYFW